MRSGEGYLVFISRNKHQNNIQRKNSSSRLYMHYFISYTT